MTDSTAAPSRDPDPPRSLPTGRIVITFGVLITLQVAVVWGLQQAFAWTTPTTNGVMAGGIVAYVAVLASILALQPWKARPMAMWTILWMGSTTIRVLLTPVALFSVYFATLLPGTAVLLGGTAAFFVALVAETVVIARAVLQPSPGSPPRSER